MSRELLKQALIALEQVTDLISESSGVSGLHLNGDNAPWGEVLKGGQFERLTNLYSVIEVINGELEKPYPDPDAWGVVNDKNKVCYASSSKNAANSVVGNDKVKPLYLLPQQQKQLTEDEIKKLYLKTVFGSGGEKLNASDLYGNEWGTVIYFVRAFEKAHGIGE